MSGEIASRPLVCFQQPSSDGTSALINAAMKNCGVRSTATSCTGLSEPPGEDGMNITLGTVATITLTTMPAAVSRAT